MQRAACVAGLVVSVALAACGLGGGDDDTTTSGDGSESATSKTVTLDVARASGRGARAIATGSINAPRAVQLRISARPKQRVAVVWGVACARQGNLSKRPVTSGDYVTVPPDIRTLPLPAKRVAICAVSARGRLLSAGRVKVTLLASTRGR